MIWSFARWLASCQSAPVGLLLNFLMTRMSVHAPPGPLCLRVQAKEQKRALKKQAQKQMKMVRVG